MTSLSKKRSPPLRASPQITGGARASIASPDCGSAHDPIAILRDRETEIRAFDDLTRKELSRVLFWWTVWIISVFALAFISAASLNAFWARLDLTDRVAAALAAAVAPGLLFAAGFAWMRAFFLRFDLWRTRIERDLVDRVLGRLDQTFDRNAALLRDNQTPETAGAAIGGLAHAAEAKRRAIIRLEILGFRSGNIAKIQRFDFHRRAALVALLAAIMVIALDVGRAALAARMGASVTPTSLMAARFVALALQRTAGLAWATLAVFAAASLTAAALVLVFKLRVWRRALVEMKATLLAEDERDLGAEQAAILRAWAHDTASQLRDAVRAGLIARQGCAAGH